jgi:hypothetical protein
MLPDTASIQFLLKLLAGGLIGLFFLWVAGKLVGGKVGHFVELLIAGIKDEFTTMAGKICFIGVIIFAFLILYSEALDFLLKIISPQHISDSPTTQPESSLRVLFGIFLFVTILLNIGFLGFTKKR